MLDKKKGQRGKQWSTEHYKENYRLIKRAKTNNGLENYKFNLTNHISFSISDTHRKLGVNNLKHSCSIINYLCKINTDNVHKIKSTKRCWWIALIICFFVKSNGLLFHHFHQQRNFHLNSLNINKARDMAMNMQVLWTTHTYGGVKLITASWPYHSW